MDFGRTAARARRTLAAVVLGWLAALAGAVLLAPAASAGTTVTIGTTAPAPLTLHPGDPVTFVNGIAPLPVTVPGVVPVKATVLTIETLGGPCGGHTLAPGASYAQAFSQSATCSISYAYSAQGAPLAAVQGRVPPLPSPTSLVVTVLQAVSSAVSSAAPPAPAPAPAPAPVPVPQPAPAPGGGGGSGGGTGTTGATGGGTTTTGSSGGGVSGGSVGAPAGAAQVGAGTPASSSGPAASGSRAGFGTPSRNPDLMPAGHGGASVPVARLLSGPIDAPLSDFNAGRSTAPAAATDGGTAPALPVAALAAVVALSTVVAVLVRTHLAARSAS